MESSKKIISVRSACSVVSLPLLSLLVFTENHVIVKNLVIIIITTIILEEIRVTLSQ